MLSNFSDQVLNTEFQEMKLQKGTQNNTDPIFTRFEENFFGILASTFFILGVPSSAISMCYFVSRIKKSINTYLFILINITDLSTCTLMLFIGISHFGVKMFFENDVFCNLWAVTWQITIRLSVLLVALLSITRTCTILKPLKPISSRAALTVALIYTFMLIGQSSIPYWVDSHYTYMRDYSRCTWNSTEYLGCSYADKVYTTFQMLLEWSLPIVPVFISCSILILELKFSTRPGSQSSVTKKRLAQRESSITVSILTSAYILCSVPSALFQFIYYISYIRGCGNSKRLAISPLPKTLLTTFAIPLNSVINTVVYYCRIKDLQLFALRLLRIHDRIYPREKHRRIPHNRSGRSIQSSGISVFSK